MNKLLLTNTPCLQDGSKPDVTNWYSIYKFMNLNLDLVDRCDTIKTPYRFHNYFSVPIIPNSFNKTYKEICIERASQILSHAQNINKPIVILYSGGIDSTAIVVSFLLATSDTSNITIAMNAASIQENPNFYYSHIRGKFNLIPSERTLDLLTGDYVMVSGEFNDQLFGTDALKLFTFDQLYEPYSESNIVPFFERVGMETRQSKIWFSLFHNHVQSNGRCEIKDVKDFFWWMCFTFKWQSIYFRILSRTTRRDLINKEFLDTYYHHFYNTEDFQCWSMMNPNKKIVKDWRGYKITTKELILEYTQDQEYFENKIKIGSLSGIFKQRSVPQAVVINEDNTFDFIDKINKDAYYDPINSFNQ
jgi:hypothetical protein